jgi:predicted RNA binding protein YcfA (HicA-like mRNA interferase family)
MIKILNSLGYVEARQTGSHKQFKKAGSGNVVTIAFHNQDIKQRTLRSILRQTGLTTEEFIKLLKS